MCTSDVTKERGERKNENEKTGNYATGSCTCCATAVATSRNVTTSTYCNAYCKCQRRSLGRFKAALSGLYILPPMRPITFHRYTCHSAYAHFCNQVCNKGSPHFSRATRLIKRRGSGISHISHPASLSFTRNMSSSPTKRLFSVYAPDYTHPGTLDLRLSVREEHMKGIDRLRSTGIASTYILLQYHSQP